MAATEKLTGPLPLPLGDVTVNQLASDEAVHAQPAGDAVRFSLRLELPAAPMFLFGAANDMDVQTFGGGVVPA